jgi:predicted dehydrogenase
VPVVDLSWLHGHNQMETCRQRTWGVVPQERQGRLHAGHTTRPWPSERGDWTEFYASFANAVRGRGVVPVDPWDAVASLEVLEAARRSTATEQVVAIGPGTALR